MRSLPDETTYSRIQHWPPGYLPRKVVEAPHVSNVAQNDCRCETGRHALIPSLVLALSYSTDFLENAQAITTRRQTQGLRDTKHGDVRPAASTSQHPTREAEGHPVD
jgi:hypothetical protein